VLVPDLPGHGLSSGPPLRSIEALADWLPCLLDAAGVEQAILVGHSMGSLIALECAARHPQRVHRTGAARGLGTDAGRRGPAQPRRSASRQRPSDDERVFADGQRSSCTGGGHGIWGPGVTLAIMRRSPPGVLAIDLANCNNYGTASTRRRRSLARPCCWSPAATA
jgi:pimeloyl-ACP methyl ester carboxylesterase